MVLGGDQKVEGLWQSRRVEPQSAVLGRNETLSSLRGRRGRTDVGCLRRGASPTDRAGGERVRSAAALDRTKESNLEHEPNIVAIIQARMGSTRLPGKVLADIAGKPMLARIVSRVEQATLIQKVVVAISDATEDDRVAEFCERQKIAVFRGSKQMSSYASQPTVRSLIPRSLTESSPRIFEVNAITRRIRWCILIRTDSTLKCFPSRLWKFHGVMPAVPRTAST